jgi:hypothetical protein
MKIRSKTAKTLGEQLSDHWNLSDPAANVLLEELLDCYDRLQSHKAVLAKRGAVCLDRFGIEKVSAAFVAVRDELTTFGRLLKALNLEADGDADNRPGRPDAFFPETNKHVS